MPRITVRRGAFDPGPRAVAWLDVALRARLPGVPGFCEGKVIQFQEQETYLVEWSYPNPLSGEPVTFRQSAAKLLFTCDSRVNHM